MALRTLLLTSLVTGVSLFVSAQQGTSQPPSVPNGPTAQSESQTPPPTLPKKEGVYVPKTTEEVEREKAIEKKEQSQKALGVVPMFSVTDRLNAPPLTPGGKFHLMAKTFTDPFVYFIIGVQAGIGQANNSFAEYGQGAEGYFKRYGANFTDSADSNFFSNFFYPVLFKQDPRYFRLGQGTAKKRIFFAASQVFVARQDSGRRNFHFSNVLGAFTAGTISNAYYPKDDRGVGLTCSRAAIALGYGALGNLGVEFWPDIDRHVIHRKQWRATHPSPGPVDTPK